MVQTAALLKPSQKVLDAIKEYTVKIDSETISDLPLKATLIFEALQKYNVSAAALADVLGKSPEIVNIYLNQRIDPNLLMDLYGVPYREIDRAIFARQYHVTARSSQFSLYSLFARSHRWNRSTGQCGQPFATYRTANPSRRWLLG